MTTVTTTENYPALFTTLVVELAGEKLEQARRNEREALETLVGRMQDSGAASGISRKASAAVGAETTRKLWENFVEQLTWNAEHHDATVEQVVEAAKRTAMQMACSVCRASGSTSMFTNVCDHAQAEAAVEFLSPGFGHWGSVDNVVERSETRAKQKLATVEYLHLADAESEQRKALDKIGRARSESGRVRAEEALDEATSRVESAREAVLVKLAEAGWQGTEVY